MICTDYAPRTIQDLCQNTLYVSVVITRIGSGRTYNYFFSETYPELSELQVIPKYYPTYD